MCCTVGVCSGIALPAVVFTANAQLAGAMPADHSGMGHAADAAAGPPAKAFQQDGGKMMKGMDRPCTGDADKDVGAREIAHHQRAAEKSLRSQRHPEPH